jgi:N-acyl-D-amino-acid deacylase
MSSGLFTPPGNFAKSDEIKTLCAVLKKYNAAYFTHIRDESNKVMDALEEAIDIARATGVHVEIVHLKCSGVDKLGVRRHRSSTRSLRRAQKDARSIPMLILTLPVQTH